jgi:class 3 adenylate cyclase
MECWVRWELALSHARAGRVKDGREQLDRLREITGPEDWRGAKVRIELAAGALDVAAGDSEEGLTRLDAAQAQAQRWGLRVDEARIVYEKGAALRRLERRREALDTLDECLSLFRTRGMGGHWVEAVVREKLRAQGIDPAELGTSIDAVVESVQAEPPDLRPAAAPDGTVTIAFSDIEGSTILCERLGDTDWLALLHEHNAVVHECVALHGGRVIKSQGDGFMLAFPSPANGLECARAIQRAFSERIADEPIRVRIGLHTGQAIAEQGDLFGRNVALAARVAASAGGGEILVSSATMERTADEGAFAFGSPRRATLKGIAGEHTLHPVEWRPTPIGAT